MAEDDTTVLPAMLDLVCAGAASIERLILLGFHLCMKPSRSLLLLAPLLMFGLASCPETTVPRDFGTAPLKLNRGEWEGTWQEAGGGDALRFEVRDAAQGQITVHVPDKEKKTEEAVEVFLHETGAQGHEELAFFTSLSEAGSAWGSLSLASRPKDGVFHLWSLRHPEVEAAVKSGELAGRLKSAKEKGDEKPHNHTELSADPSNYPKVIQARFWEWTKPATYVRVPAK